jgi:hypothetical protein
LKRSNKIDISKNFYDLKLKKNKKLYLFNFLNNMKNIYFKINIYMNKFDILFFFFKRLKGFFLLHISYLFILRKRRKATLKNLKRFFKVIRFFNKKKSTYFLEVEGKHEFFIIDYFFKLYKYNLLIFRKLYFFFNSLLKKKKYVIRRRRRTHLQIAQDNVIKEQKIKLYKKLLKNPWKIKPDMVFDASFIYRNERPSMENKHKLYIDKKYNYKKNLSKSLIPLIQVKVLKKILEYKALLLNNLSFVTKLILKNKRKVYSTSFSKFFKKSKNQYTLFCITFLNTLSFFLKKKSIYTSFFLLFDLNLYRRLNNVNIKYFYMFSFSFIEKVIYFFIKLAWYLFYRFFWYSLKYLRVYLYRHNLKKIYAKFIKVFEYKSSLLYNLEKNLNSVTVYDLYSIIKIKKKALMRYLFFPILKFIFKKEHNFGLIWFEFLNIYNILVVLNFLLESNSLTI